ncbi:MAG: LysR substrate-binding domain-containing protein [Gammaproteobacteria bacterium]
MNLRDLQYIIAVAETHHFGHAAERCFVSQPTLSGQIKKLEDELGVAVFERTNRSVEITPVGEAILMHARQIMEQVDAIEQLARASQDPLAGPLRVGAIPTLSPYLMPLILAPLKKQHPQMKLVITRKDLERENLLLLAEGHCLADQAMEVCHMQERSNQGDFADLRAASLETLLQLVGAGYGTTLVPALALRGSWTTGSGVVAQPLSLPHASRRVSLVYRRSFPRLAALEAFAEVIRANLPNTVSLISEGKRHRQKSISHK